MCARARVCVCVCVLSLQRHTERRIELTTNRCATATAHEDDDQVSFHNALLRS